MMMSELPGGVVVTGAGRGIGRALTVNVASIHSLVTVPNMFLYAAAKSGVIGLSRSLAMDLGPRNIRVNSISPGWTRTRLVQDWFDAQDDPTAAEQSVLDAHPMGRIAEPLEIAEAIAFLLSPASSAITGAELRTDVGLSAKMAT
jgi:NAD(P)-dependent dehydrogenase (short-subunit alcohol dehydrogenase family)